MESQGLTAARFADEIGVQRSAVSHILSDRNKPGYDFIYKILTRFKQLNAEWLIVGTGSMLKDFQQASLFPGEPAEKMNEIIPPLFSKNFPESQMHENKTVQEEIAPKYETPLNIHKNKSIEKIVFFYSDKTFSQFDPND